MNILGATHEGGGLRGATGVAKEEGLERALGDGEPWRNPCCEGTRRDEIHRVLRRLWSRHLLGGVGVHGQVSGKELLCDECLWALVAAEAWVRDVVAVDGPQGRPWRGRILGTLALGTSFLLGMERI